MDVRRVVTGHDEHGKAVFVSDERVAPVTVSLMPGMAFLSLWGGDAPPTFPDDGSLPPHTTWFPPVDGYRFAIVTLPPAAQAVPPDDLDVEAAVAETQLKLPGLLDSLEPDDPGMHTSDTVDVVLFLSGELALELDDGCETVLRAGDVVVQNGTRHRWHNRGDEPAVFAVVLVGAHRR